MFTVFEEDIRPSAIEQTPEVERQPYLFNYRFLNLTLAAVISPFQSKKCVLISHGSLYYPNFKVMTNKREMNVCRCYDVTILNLNLLLDCFKCTNVEEIKKQQSIRIRLRFMEPANTARP